MSNPRICIISPEFIGPFPNGGVGTACYWEAFTLGHAGYDVTVLYTGPTERETPEHWEQHFAAAAPFRYVDVTRCAPTGDVSRLAHYDHFCAEARTSELVLAWLRGQSFDLVLFQEFLGHGARALQARRSGDALEGTRAATTLHSSRQWIYEGMNRFPGGPWDLAVDFLEKESARLADCVIAPSRHMAEWAASRWRLGSTAVIPYCYDATLARPSSVVEHAGPFRHLVFFGRLETRKGLHLFCRALVNTPGLREHFEQVTFLGKPSSVEGLASENFIAEQMSACPGLRWNILGDLGSFEAQSWLSSQKNALVVAPSLVDNLPYAVIELHTRRIPFISTNIGGIPEIVGEANRHVLASATQMSLGSVIERVCLEGTLVVDYRSGYDVAASNDAHVDFVRSMLAEPVAPSPSPRLPAFDVVVTNEAAGDSLFDIRARLGSTDQDMLSAHWVHFEQWEKDQSTRPALFLDVRVMPQAGCAARMLSALRSRSTDAATAYFLREDGPGHTAVVAPLGASLEMGWRQNTFGGPCFAANPSAFAAIASPRVNGAFAFWPAYAALACSGISLAIIPTPLYTVPAEALHISGHAELEAVVHQFNSRAPAALDLGWVLKSSFGFEAGNSSFGFEGGDKGGSMYDRFVSTRDDLIEAYAGLAPETASDPFNRDFAAIRECLGAAMSRWRESDPRVFVYGAGQHAKMMFTVCPELGRFVAGFIDRRPMRRFLGKPCITPDAFRDDMADVVVYSSREFEHEMYARLKAARVEHVLLYRASPPAPEASTAMRLRNRFGHEGRGTAALGAMYRPPSWATGYVSRGDADFLLEMVVALQPHTVVELGIASGASSAALLLALDQLPDPETRVLYSCDVSPTCYFNEAYETGQACLEMYPEPRARWRREFDRDARRLNRILGAAGVDLTFIDANHCHPWPLLDLLHVCALAKPGSWVVLHDVDLPIQHPEHQLFGPRWLFQAWPFNKVKGVGQWTSIGAVQLPQDPSHLVPMALALLDKTWEHAPTIGHIQLPDVFREVQTDIETRLSARASILVAS